MILPVAIFLLVAGSWLAIVGAAALAAYRVKTDFITDCVVFVGLVVIVVVLDGGIDETTLSLHPFYRGRLASSFAIRRVSDGENDIVHPYPSDDGTTLSKYEAKVPGFFLR